MTTTIRPLAVMLGKTMSNLDIHQILADLPHRYPFVMIDRVDSIIPGESIIAIKNVTINEPYFRGHFPEKPIMPGVLIIEAMAQAATLLALQTNKERNPGTQKEELDILYLFARINKVRFKLPVFPGDRLYIEVKLVNIKGNHWKCRGAVKLDSLSGKEICTAELTGAGRMTGEISKYDR